jgi:hypothetical protein
MPEPAKANTESTTIKAQTNLKKRDIGISPEEDVKENSWVDPGDLESFVLPTVLAIRSVNMPANRTRIFLRWREFH